MSRMASEVELGTRSDNWVAAAALVVAVAASSALTACSSDRPAAGLDGAQTGSPKTGVKSGAGAAAPTASSDAEAHEARVRAALARIEGGAQALPESKSRPVIEVDLEIDGQAARFEGRYHVFLLNAGAQPLSRFELVVPANEGADTSAPKVALTAARVGGELVTVGGTSARWEVPVALGPGRSIELELEFQGGLARGQRPASAAGAPGDRPAQGLGGLLDQLEQVPELARLVPVVPVVDPTAATTDGMVDVVAGLPRPQAGAAIWQLTIVARPDAEVDASGVRVATEHAAGEVRHRFVARASGIAAVVSRGLSATSAVLADLPVTVRTTPEQAARAQELLGDVRRALEVLKARWGRSGARALSLVARGDVDAVASAPGLVLVPARLLDAPAPEPAGAAPKVSLSSMLNGLVAHHPAASEALTFALVTAIAQAWWEGRGEDAAADNLLRAGLSRQAALAVVAGKGGDKSARRALELGLRLPLQLAFERGDTDVVLGTFAGGGPGGEMAALKAGLFMETLARHLGQAQMEGLEKRLLSAARPVDVATLRSEILALAPRPEETRELLARWLDRAELQQELGPLRPEVLLEYLVADGAVGSMSHLLLGQMGADGLGGRALSLLGEGQALDAGLALSLLGELAAEDADPTTKKWLTLGSQLLGGPDQQHKAVDGLVDELGAELGIPESERSRLKQLSTLLLEALRDPAGEPPADPTPPPSP